MQGCFISTLVAFTASLATPAADALEARIENSLKKSARHLESIATRGGWVGIYDLASGARFGESLREKAESNEIWVQPPGTPSVGQVFLRAHALTGDGRYLRLARDAGRALAWGQRQEGGWDHLVNVASLTPEAVEPRRVSGRCTLDDDITQGALRFLMALAEEVDEAWLRDSIQLGLRFMLDAQYESGGWPQWYPLRGGYHDHVTFNDGTMNDCISVMLEAYRRYEDPRYLQSARKAGDFLLKSQRAEPQAGWAQQIDAETLEPKWARRFEPPGICSAVTARNIHTLLHLSQVLEDDRYLGAIPKAISWLEASALAGSDIHSSKKQDEERIWARLYEMGTNKPIYGDREDGNRIFYHINNISQRERTSYGWQGSFGISKAIAAYQKRDEAKSVSKPRSVEYWERRLGPIFETQDEEGRWTSEEQLRIHDAVKHLDQLCDALEDLKER